MNLKLYQVDAFTNKLFSGNPAAVIPLPSWLPDKLLQNIAQENNLSETAFFVGSESHYEIRWFTPEQEVDLCGHATLASSYVIFTHISPELEALNFNSKSGPLKVSRDDNDLISLDFPGRMPVEVSITREFIDCFGIKPLSVWKTRDYLFEFPDEKTIVHLKPNYEAIVKLDSLGLIVTARGDKHDFVSRFFAPRAGIPEDPVTGSAHSTLIPFWSMKLGKVDLTAFQCSTRGGSLFCRKNGERVIISGYAAQYLKGEIDI